MTLTSAGANCQVSFQKQLISNDHVKLPPREIYIYILKIEMGKNANVV